MTAPASYSIQELVRESGFDRRTIVYYIQQGLLPRVGRRGPQTRYPAECLYRLMFIKGIKELQRRGELPTVTLGDLGQALGALSPARVESLLAAGLPASQVATLFRAGPGPPPPAPGGTNDRPAAGPPGLGAESGPAGDRRSYGLADAGIRQRYPGSAGAAPGPGPQPTAPAGPAPMPSPEERTPDEPAPEPLTLAHLGELLRELELRPGLQQSRSRPGGPEQWTEVPITSRVYLSVRGLAPADAPLAEAVGRALKRALRS